jgi:hypothetical protein
VVAIVDAVFADASNSSQGDAVEAVLAATQAALQKRLDGASQALYDHQMATVGALVKKLAAGAKEAQGRKSELQGEILHNLEEATEHHVDDEAKTDEWERDQGEKEEAGDDEKWATETERWHNQTVEVFFEKLTAWLHPNITTEGNGTDAQPPKGAPSPNYTNQSALYGALSAAHAQVVGDVKQWRAVQALLHAKASEIQAMGLPAYSDADEPEDDGYQVYREALAIALS